MKEVIKFSKPLFINEPFKFIFMRNEVILMAKNNLSKLNLKGNVKSIKQTTRYAVGSFECILSIFDCKGNKIEVNDCDASLNYKHTSKYDSRGNEIESVTYNPDGSLSLKYTYKYDNKGNQIEENFLGLDDIIHEKSIRKYDSKGNLTSGCRYDKDGRLLSKWTCKYDSEGYEICEKWDGSEYSCSKRKATIYNNYGNWTERYFYDEDDNLSMFSTFKYDNKGNNIEMNLYNPDGIHVFVSYTKYDKNGNEIEMTIYNPDGSLDSIITYKYKYDKMGNWIYKLENSNDKLLNTFEREIEYYSDLSFGILHDDNLN